MVICCLRWRFHCFIAKPLLNQCVVSLCSSAALSPGRCHCVCSNVRCSGGNRTGTLSSSSWVLRLCGRRGGNLLAKCSDVVEAQTCSFAQSRLATRALEDLYGSNAQRPRPTRVRAHCCIRLMTSLGQSRSSTSPRWDLPSRCGTLPRASASSSGTPTGR